MESDESVDVGRSMPVHLKIEGSNLKLDMEKKEKAKNTTFASRVVTCQFSLLCCDKSFFV